MACNVHGQNDTAESSHYSVVCYYQWEILMYLEISVSLNESEMQFWRKFLNTEKRKRQWRTAMDHFPKSQRESCNILRNSAYQIQLKSILGLLFISANIGSSEDKSQAKIGFQVSEEIKGRCCCGCRGEKWTAGGTESGPLVERERMEQLCHLPEGIAYCLKNQLHFSKRLKYMP